MCQYLMPTTWYACFLIVFDSNTAQYLNST